jgi:hypothetical protein
MVLILVTAHATLSAGTAHLSVGPRRLGAGDLALQPPHGIDSRAQYGRVAEMRQLV